MTKNKVCVVGGESGVVGMATRDLLLALGFDVATSDRPENDTNRADRQTKRENYATLKTNPELLDYKQAEWLKKQLPESEDIGTQSATPSLANAFAEGVGIFVITTGLPRKPEDDRSTLLLKNEPIFKNYGKEIAEAYLNNIDKPFPKIVIVGNPVDQMTEVLYKEVEAVLKAAKKNESDVYRKAKIEATLENLINNILGQGGILDGARAAFYIKQEMGIDVTSAPVLGTHNKKMVIDFANIVPSIHLTEKQKKDIHKLTYEGGSAVGTDIKEKTTERDENNEITKEGISQSAFLATAAATAILVEALVSEKPVQLPVSCHGKVSGATLGRMCDVSENGAVVTGWKGDIQKGRESYKDARGAMKDLAAAKAVAAQSSSPTPS